MRVLGLGLRIWGLGFGVVGYVGFRVMMYRRSPGPQK